MSKIKSNFLAGKRVLVTGGTGSLGQVLVKRLLSGEMGTPLKVIVMSRDEAKQHDMRLRFQNKLISTDEVIYNNFKQLLEFRIGDVRDFHDVCAVLSDSDVVFNAAALKQVPVCEYFPEQAILTNCVGAANIVRAVKENGYDVDTIVGISTDKACKPVNAMGISKALQERVFIAANVLNPDTRFICVRYGNVLASRGSVIPLFHQQINIGGPVTITHENMTRFLLTTDDAVDTVFAAIHEANPGEIFVPKAPAATILNIAKALIGEREIDIDFTGIRPGEKMHEIMVSEEEYLHTEPRGDFLAIKPMLPELNTNTITNFQKLEEFSSENDLLTFDETHELLQKHGLTLEQSSKFEGLEIIA